MYSIIAVTISIPIFLFITYYLSTAQIIIGSSEKIVADQMHDVGNIIEEDFIRALKISGRRSILALISESLINGTYLNETIKKMDELMLNGTINGEQNPFLINNTLNDWIEKIITIPVGFNVNINYHNLTIRPINEFNIRLGIILILNISERTGKMRLDKTEILETEVSVIGLEDPLFPINTRGFAKRIVQKYPYKVYALKLGTGIGVGNCSGNVTFDENDQEKARKILVIHNASNITGFLGIVAETSDTPSVSCYNIGISNIVNIVNKTLNTFGYKELYLDNKTNSVWYLPIKLGIENGYYFSEPGPNLFQRLEGNLTNETTGFQTFVNTEELENLGIPIKQDQSRTDYLYFSNQTINGVKVRGLPEWFRIDFQTAEIYNLTELLG